MPDQYGQPPAPEAAANSLPNNNNTPLVVALSLSLIIHTLVIAAFALDYFSRNQNHPNNPAIVDVVEFEDPALGTPNHPQIQESLDLGTPIVSALQTPNLQTPDVQPAPEVDPAIPEIDRSNTTPDNTETKRWKDQLAELDAAIDQLRAQLNQGGKPGGGDHGRDPNSRGEQQKRWRIVYGLHDCDIFRKLLRDIGIEEVGILRHNRIYYVKPVAGKVRHGTIDDENRIFWTNQYNIIAPCEREILRRARLSISPVIWFMRRSEEPLLQKLEAQYADQHNLDIADIRTTEFVPYKDDARWRLRVQRMY